jgi:hypothetical protein
LAGLPVLLDRHAAAKHDNGRFHGAEHRGEYRVGSTAISTFKSLLDRELAANAERRFALTGGAGLSSVTLH